MATKKVRQGKERSKVFSDLSLDLRHEHEQHVEGPVTRERYRRALAEGKALLAGLEAMESEQSDPRCAAILEHVVRAVEAAWSSWTGAAALDKKAGRVAATIELLDLARARVTAGESAVEAAWLPARLAPLIDPELRRIDQAAWVTAVGEWQGELPPPRGNPRGRQRYDWRKVVFGLLAPHALTDASDARALGELRRQAKLRRPE